MSAFNGENEVQKSLSNIWHGTNVGKGKAFSLTFLFCVLILEDLSKKKQKPETAMREDQQRPVHLYNHQRNKFFITTKLFTHTTVYVIIVLLSYTLGYLSHSSPPPPPPPLPPPPSVFQLASLPTQLDNFRVAAHCSNSPLPPHLVFPTILQRVFKGSSPYTDFPPPHLRYILKPKRIRGWGSNGDVFEHLIKRVKPKLIVEVGTFLGASALHMVNVTRKLGLQTQILCLDDFRGWPGFRDRFKDINDINGDVLLLQQFMQNVVYFNATGSVLPVPFSTRSGLEKLCEWGIMADLLEIDAGHDFISAWGDINERIGS
ncbi:hypothetical protein V6Z11_D12G134900 [Gossypium hirsutum]